ncbi:winged helix DNA-binding domain-containing protein [Agromyces sp. NPDC056523]|uniref:winged helix DNA-binding domain-containing protein n=1 Tax=Agromyces sp. NPDC056523 TaxID=3345850 RepID=UPI00366D26C6
MAAPSSPALRATRLASHGFRTRDDDAIAVVERLGAMQAQDLAAAKWAVGSRMSHPTVEAVDAAIESRRIVRSWPMRGTLHLIPTGMLRPVLAITGPRVLAQAKLRHRQLELGPAEYRTARTTVERELAGGGSATREQLAAMWSSAGLETPGQRLYHLIWWLAQDAVLCGGPVDGRVQHFSLLDEWAPAPSEAPTDRDDVLGALFAAYLNGHGPATVADFAWWSGLTLADARTALAAAGDHVESFPGGDDRYVGAGAMDAAATRPHGALALAGFDEYFLGYADRAAVCEPQFADLVVPGRNGVFQPLLVLDGRVVGTWARTGTPARPRVELRWFRPMPTDASARFHRPLGAWARFAGVALAGIDERVHRA